MTGLPRSSDFGRLTEWNPALWSVHPGWQTVVQGFMSSGQGEALAAFLKTRLAQGAVVFPAQPFRALELTAPEDVRVVILGQDPYHGPGQAQGLAFSVGLQQRIPPSLRNIHQELCRDTGLAAPTHGSLQAWARRGVLLLNTSFTVEQGAPASHAKRGWEALSEQLLTSLLKLRRPCVLMLWGAYAQSMGARALASVGDLGSPLVLTANHPSPLSARRGPLPFVGCSHFSQASRWLDARGRSIDWSLDSP